MESLYIYQTHTIGPGLVEVELIADHSGDMFCGQGKTRAIAVDRAFQVARHERRFAYPTIVYCSEEYFCQKWGFGVEKLGTLLRKQPSTRHPVIRDDQPPQTQHVTL